MNYYTDSSDGTFKGSPFPGQSTADALIRREWCDDPDCARVYHRGSLTGTKYIRPHYVDEHPGGKHEQ